MILPDRKIREWADAGNVVPYEAGNVNPASLDLRVGDAWIDFHDKKRLFFADDVILYPRTFAVDLYNFFAGLFGFKKKLTAVLAITMERIHIMNGMAGMVKLKSTLIREGLGYPIADWIDPGYEGRLTLMLTANKRIRLCAGRRIVQLVLQEMEMSDAPYNKVGHYMNQRYPTISWMEL